MRILRVIATINPSAGGPVEGLRQTSRLHTEWGHETVVVSCDTDQSSKQPSDTFELVPLGPGKFGWAYSSALKGWLETNLPDFQLVIMHGLWLYPSWALARAVDKCRSMTRETPKFYLFSHGMLDPWFQSWSRRPLKTLRNHLYWKALEARTLRTADGILFTSSEERRLAKLPFKPYKPNRETVLPYGTSTPPAHTSAQDKAFQSLVPELGSRPYVLFLSRIHEKKGLDLLITAYANKKHALKQGGRQLPALVIAGPGLDSEFGKKLSSLVKEHTLEEDVLFAGMVRGDAKWGAYHGCEAFILPSHQENFGIAVAEALACAKPVLISNKVNIFKEIQDARAGFVSDDTQAGAESLLQKWGELPEEERRQMSKRALALFERQYHIESSAKALLSLVN